MSTLHTEQTWAGLVKDHPAFVDDWIMGVFLKGPKHRADRIKVMYAMLIEHFDSVYKLGGIERVAYKIFASGLSSIDYNWIYDQMLGRLGLRELPQEDDGR